MRRINLVFIVLLSILVGCKQQRPTSVDFSAPEFVSLDSSIEMRNVLLECTLSNARVEECGFAYAAVGRHIFTEINSKIQGRSFEQEINDLKPGTTYIWYAFARSSDAEIQSDTLTFTIPPLSSEEIVSVPDKNFKAYLIEKYDSDGDGEISIYEAEKVTKIEVYTQEIYTLEGISSFVRLDTLVCCDSGFYEILWDGGLSQGKLTSLDLSANVNLKYLQCNGNYLQSLILPDSPYLTDLICYKNSIKSLDVTKLINLYRLIAYENRISDIDLSNCDDIDYIELGLNPLNSIDLSNCKNINILNVHTTNLKELDVKDKQNINYLNFSWCQIDSIDLSTLKYLKFLNISGCSISSLDLSYCTNLVEIYCESCLELEELDISMLPSLSTFDCVLENENGNQTPLKKLYVSGSQRIEGVTVNRSADYIPQTTEIIVI